MMKKATLALATVAMLTTGCLASERPINSYNEDVVFTEGIEGLGNIVAESATIQGDIGALRNFQEDAVVNGNDEGDYTNLEVIAENQRGAAMHWMDIYGGVNHPQLQPGNQLTFRSGAYPSDPNALHVEAMACQGNTAYAWDYDEPAEQVDVEVKETEDPSIVQIDYTTHVPESFGTGERVSGGSFLLHR